MSKVNKGRTKPIENRRGRSSGQPVAVGGSIKERTSRFFRGLFGKERMVPVTIGALFMGFAIFMLYAFFSYLLNGAADQSILLDQNLTSIEAQSEAMEGGNGVVGMGLMHQMVNEWVGFGILSIIAMLIGVGVGLLGTARVNYPKIIIFSAIATFWLSLFSAAIFRGIAGWFFFYPGGILGETIYQWLYMRIGLFGTWLLIILVLFLTLFLFFKSIRRKYNNWAQHKRDGIEQGAEPQAKRPNRAWLNFKKWFRNKETGSADDDELLLVPHSEEEELFDEPAAPTTPVITLNEEKVAPVEPIVVRPTRPVTMVEGTTDGIDIQVTDNRNMDDEVTTAELRAQQLVEEQGEYDPRLELSRFEMPHADLLKKYDQQTDGIDIEEIEENKRLITSTLESFRIGIKSINATVGPAITLYEVVPEEGILISRIRSLEDNISMSLSAMGIRIIAPIPGKGTIGMEVPNKNPQIVSMRSVILSKKFSESTAALPVALGRTITNDVFVFDLAKTPHLLVAGATGQGKSVGLNAIITSLLYKLHPAELKFVMIDPKMVEFSLYSLIEKHYMAKLPGEEQVIITEPKRVQGTLESLCVEMDDRYELLSKAHVRNIKEYNQMFKQRRLNPEKGHKYLPYIVLIIDEYGDLMLTGGKEIEAPITRLAQKARAVGIHAIIATQRPMASIITGAIKANFPGRLAFKVSSGIDSKIILDAQGANRLIGRGDCLFTTGNDLTRVQSAFVDTPEVNDLVRFISEQRGFPEAYPLPEVLPEGSAGAGLATGELDPNDRDELFESVARRVVADKRPAASYIQQIFGVGYNRASRLMVQLEYAGIIGPADGNKPRELLVTTVEQLDNILYPNN
ncbi:FtsK/SpoIIIE family DNA translocase [Porphyromonas levii]|uniref:FtsK/SpoIIIE family DNA translocase n=1 Tax=Porphyromonas levii TaxID=28114 RepID=UPI00036DBC38|nr:DNA translocase FtsK [Porphyromonas levii]